MGSTIVRGYMWAYQDGDVPQYVCTALYMRTHQTSISGDIDATVFQNAAIFVTRQYSGMADIDESAGIQPTVSKLPRPFSPANANTTILRPNRPSQSSQLTHSTTTSPPSSPSSTSSTPPSHHPYHPYRSPNHTPYTSSSSPSPPPTPTTSSSPFPPSPTSAAPTSLSHSPARKTPTQCCPTDTGPTDMLAKSRVCSSACSD
jgi:hypothetical protein